MRLLPIMMLLLFYPVVVVGQRVDAVRPLDHSAQATLARALEKSRLVRSLLRDLAATDVIVHVELSRHLPSGIGGTTRFVASRGGRRYIRMTLSSYLRADDRVAMLGHELQHAREIAQSAAHDRPMLERFLAGRGYRVNGMYFETAAALQVERDVRRELRSSRSEAKPVVELDHQHLRAGGAEAGAQVAPR